MITKWKEKMNKVKEKPKTKDELLNEHNQIMFEVGRKVYLAYVAYKEGVGQLGKLLSLNEQVHKMLVDEAKTKEKEEPKEEVKA